MLITSEEWLRRIGRPDPLILELGANDGEHTEMFLNLFPQARIFAFEPDPRACARFRERLHPQTSSRVLLTEAAIGAENGLAPFYQSSGWPTPADQARWPGGWDLSGSLRRPTGHHDVHPWCVFPRQIYVGVWRLDSWKGTHNIGEVDLIWADVQGAEVDVIKGGRLTLGSTRYFYTEHSSQELYDGQASLHQLMEMLPEFHVITYDENDALLERVAA